MGGAGERARTLGALAGLVLICMGLLGPMLGWRHLWETDEARYAEIAREMSTGPWQWWVIPRLNYVKYLEKPPLVCWAVAGIFKLLGPGEVQARVLEVLAATAVVVVVFWLAKTMGGVRAGFLSGLVLVTSFMFFVLGRVLVVDMVLCLGVVGAVAGAWAAGLGRRWGAYAFWSGAGVGFMTKGLLGPGLVALALGPWVVAGRRWDVVRALGRWPAVVLGAVVALPWVVAAGVMEPGFFRYFFVHEQFGRLLTTIHKRYEPPWFYAVVLPAALGGWSALLPWAAAHSWPRGRDRDEQWKWLCWGWVGLQLLLLSISRSKMMHYILPVLPGVAIMLGIWLAQTRAQGKGVTAAVRLVGWIMILGAVGLAAFPAFHPEITYKQTGALILAGAMVMAVGGLAVMALGGRGAVVGSMLAAFITGVVLMAAAAVRLDDYRSVGPLIEPIAPRLKPSDVVVTYGDYYHGAAFYAQRRYVVVGNWGELDYGRRRCAEASQWFLADDKALAKLLAGPRRVFVLAETPRARRLMRWLARQEGLPMFVWITRGDKSLISNRPMR